VSQPERVPLEQPLLAVRDLVLGDDAGALVDGVSFSLSRRGALGIVGESGSGKTLTCRALLGILPPAIRLDSGSIEFDGQEVARLDYRGWQSLRGTRIGAVFQDPGSYLNPSIPVGKQLAEVFRVKTKLGRRAAADRAIDLLGDMGLREPALVFTQYPHELSGGMLQRVLIAIALSENPQLLIADEATTALDMTIQAEVLDVFAHLRATRDLALILVSHDLAVVAQVCDQVVVLRDGGIVEAGRTQDVLRNPQHEYTRSLVADHARFGIEKYLAPEFSNV
jgi:peptide/nickel transport system ATP-binding protein